MKNIVIILKRSIFFNKALVNKYQSVWETLEVEELSNCYLLVPGLILWFYLNRRGFSERRTLESAVLHCMQTASEGTHEP